MLNTIFYYINHRIRIERNKKLRQRLVNSNICLLSNNCNGGFILHDLGLKFNSPFVNLWLSADDFVKYLANINFYRNCEISFVKDKNYNYPIGLLYDIKIYFMHYKSEEEAKEKWNIRNRRMNLDHMFIIMTEKENCSYETLKNFDALPYKNKVVLTHQPYPMIKSSYYIHGFEYEKELGILSDYEKGSLCGKRYYDQFDFVSFFNNGLK